MATNRCPVCGANLREKMEISDFHWHVNCDRCGEFEIGRRVMDDFNEEEPYKPAFPIWIISFVGPNAVFSCKIKVLASPCHHLARGPNG